ncbi:MAG: bifunctional phosphoglucose/phosphomannose isomerase [Bacteroidetes bacterium]|nr:bifunctional phosphoglucose/phosphomannose isomerase [Bacteroidota bacterium]
MTEQHEALRKFAYQINYAIENYKPHGLSASSFSNVLIGGLGGSGIGGRLVKTIFNDEFPIPVEVVADYTLPAYVNSQTLVILGSYSGNTEETLTMFEEVQKRGSQMLILTSGGKLGEWAKSNNLTTYNLIPGFQPRMALGFSLTYLVQIFAELNGSSRTEELKKISGLFEETGSYEADATEMFEQIKHKSKSKFVVLADAALEAVATRFAQQIQENAKLECFTHTLPEHNHNVIESYYGTLDSVFFFLNSNANPRVAARFEFLGNLLAVENHKVIELGVENLTLAGVYQMIHRLDWLSLYVADYRKVDSLNVPNIASLKEFLANV